MKKLTLNVEELEVNSFEITTSGHEPGTVHGYDLASGPWYCFGTWICSVRCLPEPVEEQR